MNNPALNARRAEFERAVNRLTLLADELRAQPADETVWAQAIRAANDVEHIAYLGRSAARKAASR